MKSTTILGILAVLAVATPAFAAVINVELNYSTDESYTGQGASADTGTIWNHIGNGSAIKDTTSTGLVDSTGAASSVTVTWGGNLGAQHYYVWGSANNLLGDGYHTDAGFGDGTFVINNLNPTITYDLYLYGTAGAYSGYDTDFTIGDTSKVTYTNGNAVTFVEGVNYVLFSGLTATGGTISGTVASAAAGVFNGFQLVEVPEPGALALLTLGGVGMLIRRRRA